MKNLSRHLASLAVTAWVGGLWAIGYLAVPVLFRAQPDKQLAGMLAGQMFAALGYLGMACGTCLLLVRFLESGKAALREPVFLVVVAMLVITLAIQFEIQPLMTGMKSRAMPLDVMQSTYANSFKLWHGISSILYLVESLLGALLIIRTFSKTSK